MRARSSACGRMAAGAAAAAVALLLAAAPAAGQAPVLVDTALYGGAANQGGYQGAFLGPTLLVTGWDDSSSTAGLTAGWATAPLSVSWAQIRPGTNFLDVGAAGGLVFEAGGAWPPACGASDGAGGTEWKVGMGLRTAAGADLGCWSANFFPYRGGESFWALTSQEEGGVPYAYAGGSGEQAGFNCSAPMLLAKYDGSGGLVNAVSEPFVTLGSYAGSCVGTSGIHGLTALGGDIVAVGYSGLGGAGEDGTQRPVVMRYTPALARVWKARPTDNPGGWFYEVAVLDGAIYAAGFNFNSDYLLERYSDTGVRLWTAQWGSAAIEELQGVVGVNGRLFAAGATRDTAGGDLDLVLFEIDTANGARLWETRWGGAGVDQAYHLVSDGTDLYVVGVSTSYASATGNLVGQGDVVVLRYDLCSLEPTITPSGPTDICDGGSVTLDGGAGWATYLWSPGGETTETIEVTAGGSYTVSVTDGLGGCGTSDPVVVTVHPPPEPEITTPDTLPVCPGTPVTLDATPGFAAYLWSNGATSASVEVDPAATTAYTVTVTDANGCEGSDSFTVEVKPGIPEFESDVSAIDFGPVDVGDSAVESVTVTNTECGVMYTHASIAWSLANPFSIVSDSCAGAALGEGDSCTIQVRFAPAAAQGYSGSLSLFNNNEPDEGSVLIPLRGSGQLGAAAPDLRLSSTALNFGWVLRSRTKTMTVYVRNAGTGPLTVSGAGVSGGPFSANASACLAAPVAPGASCAVRVTFAPTLRGTASSLLTIASDDPDTPAATVTLTGFGL